MDHSSSMTAWYGGSGQGSPGALDDLLGLEMSAPEPGAGSIGERFSSKVVTLKVGENKTEFTAHASIFQASPVLAKMCTGQFLEAQTGVLEFPEEDPTIFGILLEFLYTFRLPLELTKDAHRLEVHEEMVIAHKLTDLYIMADQYQMSDLKGLVVSRLDEMRHLTSKIVDFFQVTYKIYTNTSGNDHRKFHEYFCKEAVKMTIAANKSGEHRKMLKVMISEGGDFAIDLLWLFISTTREGKTKLKIADSLYEQLVKQNEQLTGEVEKKEQEGHKMYELLLEAKNEIKDNEKRLRELRASTSKALEDKMEALRAQLVERFNNRAQLVGRFNNPM